MKIIFSALLSIVFLVGCNKERIQGSGTITGEIRQLTGFDEVKVEGDFEVFIKKGTAHRVEVRTDNNVQSYVITELRDNNEELVIKYKNQANIKPSFIEIYIEMPDIDDVELNGSGRIIFPNLDFDLSDLNAEINGSGIIQLRGTVNQFDAEVNGSGTIEGFLLQAKNADLDINGSGVIETSLSDNLDGEINGSGKILYKGNPVVISNINGSGQIIKVD